MDTSIIYRGWPVTLGRKCPGAKVLLVSILPHLNLDLNDIIIKMNNILRAVVHSNQNAMFCDSHNVFQDKPESMKDTHVKTSHIGLLASVVKRSLQKNHKDTSRGSASTPPRFRQTLQRNEQKVKESPSSGVDQRDRTEGRHNNHAYARATPQTPGPQFAAPHVETPQPAFPTQQMPTMIPPHTQNPWQMDPYRTGLNIAKQDLQMPVSYPIDNNAHTTQWYPNFPHVPGTPHALWPFSHHNNMWQAYPFCK